MLCKVIGIRPVKDTYCAHCFSFYTLQVIAGCLSEEEIQGLKEMFKSIDTDNSGTITLEELIQALSKQGMKLSNFEVQ